MFSIVQWVFVHILRNKISTSRQPWSYSFTPKLLIFLHVWKHWMKWIASSIITCTWIVREHTCTGERKEGRACISLLIRDGAAKLEELSEKLHHEQGYMSKESVWHNAVPDPFHPFDWAYFSTARWAENELFVFTYIRNRAFSPSQLKGRNANSHSIT